MGTVANSEHLPHVRLSSKQYQSRGLALRRTQALHNVLWLHPEFSLILSLNLCAVSEPWRHYKACPGSSRSNMAGPRPKGHNWDPEPLAWRQTHPRLQQARAPQDPGGSTADSSRGGRAEGRDSGRKQMLPTHHQALSYGVCTNTSLSDPSPSARPYWNACLPTSEDTVIAPTGVLNSTTQEDSQRLVRHPQATGNVKGNIK